MPEDEQLRASDKARDMQKNIETAESMIKLSCFVWLVIIAFASRCGLGNATLAQSIISICMPILGMLFCVTAMVVVPIALICVATGRIVKKQSDQ